jgi:hypothetical protein
MASSEAKLKQSFDLERKIVTGDITEADFASITDADGNLITEPTDDMINGDAKRNSALYGVARNSVINNIINLDGKQIGQSVVTAPSKTGQLTIYNQGIAK